MKVEWLPEAERNRQRHGPPSAAGVPGGALDLGDAIEAAVARLADYPESARPGRVQGTRELVVTGTPWIVVYRIEPAAIVILRVLHGAQRWPPVPARKREP